MTRDTEQGFRFVAGMIAVLCAIFGLAALLGVPAAGTIFFGMAGMLLGIGSARALLPRRDWRLAGKTVLMFVTIGGIFVGYRLSVLDFATVRGVFFLGPVPRFLANGVLQAYGAYSSRAHRGLKTGGSGPRRLSANLAAPMCYGVWLCRLFGESGSERRETPG